MRASPTAAAHQLGDRRPLLLMMMRLLLLLLLELAVLLLLPLLLRGPRRGSDGRAGRRLAAHDAGLCVFFEQNTPPGDVCAKTGECARHHDACAAVPPQRARFRLKKLALCSLWAIPDRAVCSCTRSRLSPGPWSGVHAAAYGGSDPVLWGELLLPCSLPALVFSLLRPYTNAAPLLNRLYATPAS